MRAGSLFSCTVTLVLLAVGGCGSEMTDEQDSTAGTSAGSGGTYTGSAGASGYGGTGVAGQSGTGGVGGSGGSAGWPGTAGEAGSAGWPGTAGTAGSAGEAGSAGWQDTGGASGWQGGGDNIALEDTPAAVQAAIDDLLGSTPVEDIQLNDEDGTVSYEVTATVDGNQIEYVIAEDGTLLRTQEEIDPTALPAAVQTTVTAEIGDAEIRRVEKITEDGQVYYEIPATSAQGDRINLTVAEDGTLLEGEEGGQQGGG